MTKLTPEQAVENWRVFGTQALAAEESGVPLRTFQRLVAKGRQAGEGDGFAVDLPPKHTRTFESLLRDRLGEFNRTSEHWESRSLVRVRIKDKPIIGLLHFGDLHIDDPGCDMRKLLSDTELVKRTDGLYGTSIGDHENNWIGRLERCHGKQTVTRDEAKVLVQGWLKMLEGKLLYIVGGNHDAWSQGNGVLDWITETLGQGLFYHGARFELNWPGKKVPSLRINARHDFKGTAQYHPCHGMTKAALGGMRDHLFICGHRHFSADETVPLPDTTEPLVAKCVRLAAYKVWDEYALQEGFVQKPNLPSCVTVLRPLHPNPYEKVQLFWDVEEGAEYLTWCRNRFNKGETKW